MTDTIILRLLPRWSYMIVMKAPHFNTSLFDFIHGTFVCSRYGWIS